MQFDATLVICSHNPRPEYLTRVLKSVRDQTLNKECWEFLLIDNASATALRSIYDISWHPHARHIEEPELGLAPARRRAIREARADLLVFVDDDNVLQSEYLTEAIRIKQEWPKLGAWGSAWTVPEFEKRPQPHLLPYMSYLAVRELTTARWTNVAATANALRKDAMPWGAGLCVRATVAGAYSDLSAGSAINITGRQGAVLTSGDDIELCLAACASGFGMGIFPELKLVHLIPERRISEDYLVRLAEGIAITDDLLTYKWLGVLPRDPFSFLGLLSFLKNVLTTRGVDRRMYLAHWRARARARRMIDRSRRGPGAGTTPLLAQS
jgi:glycosyltransferase involved in cell wall biosynthesis